MARWLATYRLLAADRAAAEVAARRVARALGVELVRVQSQADAEIADEERSARRRERIRRGLDEDGADP